MVPLEIYSYLDFFDGLLIEKLLLRGSDHLHKLLVSGKCIIGYIAKCNMCKYIKSLTLTNHHHPTQIPTVSFTCRR